MVSSFQRSRSTHCSKRYVVTCLDIIVLNGLDVLTIISTYTTLYTTLLDFWNADGFLISNIKVIWPGDIQKMSRQCKSCDQVTFSKLINETISLLMIFNIKGYLMSFRFRLWINSYRTLLFDLRPSWLNRQTCATLDVYKIDDYTQGGHN